MASNRLAIFDGENMMYKRCYYMMLYDYGMKDWFVDQKLIFSAKAVPWDLQTVMLLLPRFPMSPATIDVEMSWPDCDTRQLIWITGILMEEAVEVLKSSTLVELVLPKGKEKGMEKIQFRQGCLGIKTNWKELSVDATGTRVWECDGSLVGLSHKKKVRLTINAGFDLLPGPRKGRSIRFFVLLVDGSPELTLLILRAFAYAGKAGVKFWGGGDGSGCFDDSIGPKDGLPYIAHEDGVGLRVRDESVGRLLAAMNRNIEWYRFWRSGNKVGGLPYFIHPLIDKDYPYAIINDASFARLGARFGDPPADEVLQLIDGACEPAPLLLAYGGLPPAFSLVEQADLLPPLVWRVGGVWWREAMESERLRRGLV